MTEIITFFDQYARLDNTALVGPPRATNGPIDYPEAATFEGALSSHGVTE